jgi:hypothetical protein
MANGQSAHTPADPLTHHPPAERLAGGFTYHRPTGAESEQTMTTQHHTRGPWTVQQGIQHGSNPPSRQLVSHFRIYGDGILITELFPPQIEEEREMVDANARLIAAAPELLEQLKQARQYVAKVAAEAISPVFANRRLRDMQLTIDKAEGV